MQPSRRPPLQRHRQVCSRHTCMRHCNLHTYHSVPGATKADKPKSGKNGKNNKPKPGGTSSDEDIRALRLEKVLHI